MLEPFYDGSHRQLVDLLAEELSGADLVTMPGKKWHWRARTAAMYLSEQISASHNYEVLFASSVLNLAELLALRPDLVGLRKILYFHENQLVYPVQQCKERDFQYGYNQILSAMVADCVVFNSAFNRDSFLNNLTTFLKLIPDCRPTRCAERITPKCRVLAFPLRLPPALPDSRAEGPLHVLWPHRWEHDKQPEVFFQALLSLHQDGLPFRLSVLGAQFTDNPTIFATAKEQLAGHIEHWGFISSKADFYYAVNACDVVVSTAAHEFFGVAVLEAVALGCVPLCPNRLVYPELFDKANLYNTDCQLRKTLARWCKRPDIPRAMAKINVNKFSWDELKDNYRDLLI